MNKRRKLQQRIEVEKKPTGKLINIRRKQNEYTRDRIRKGCRQRRYRAKIAAAKNPGRIDRYNTSNVSVETQRDAATNQASLSLYQTTLVHEHTIQKLKVD